MDTRSPDEVLDAKANGRKLREAVLESVSRLTSLDLLSGFEMMDHAMCISDPALPDEPVVYVNPAFERMTGFSSEEIIGTNCRFLQGIDTDVNETSRLRRAIDRGEECTIEIVNYRKDGTPFWNALHVGALRDADGNRLYLLGTQSDVTDTIAYRSHSHMEKLLAREMHHRVKNLLAVTSSIVRLSARSEPNVSRLVEKASARIEALGRAHAATFEPDGPQSDMADLHLLVEAMLRPFRKDSSARVIVDGPSVRLPIASITPMALALHELASNAQTHGALNCKGGSLKIDWERQGDQMKLEWVEHCGDDGRRNILDGKGFGMRAVATLLASANGRIEHVFNDNGLYVEIALAVPAD